MRKTLLIEDLKYEINRILSLPNICDDEKKGLCFLLESFLHKTGNYKGYTHNEIFTPGCREWKLKNPDKNYMDYVKHEYDRAYI